MLFQYRYGGLEFYVSVVGPNTFRVAVHAPGEFFHGTVGAWGAMGAVKTMVEQLWDAFLDPAGYVRGHVAHATTMRYSKSDIERHKREAQETVEFAGRNAMLIEKALAQIEGRKKQDWRPRKL